MFSAYGVLDKIANGGGAFVAGAILTAVAFPTAAAPGSVDPEILRNLALANLPIIVVFNLGSLAFLSRTPSPATITRRMPASWPSR